MDCIPSVIYEKNEGKVRLSMIIHLIRTQELILLAASQRANQPITFAQQTTNYNWSVEPTLLSTERVPGISFIVPMGS